MSGRAIGWVLSWAYRLGIIAGYAYGNINPDGKFRYTVPRSALTSRRPYILGKTREWWRCLLVAHHLRGDEIGFGMCAKCVPWHCCGSKVEAHAEGCKDQ